MAEKVNPRFQGCPASIAQQPVDFKGLVGPFCRQKKVVAVRENQSLLDPFSSVELRPEQPVHIRLLQPALKGFNGRAGYHVRYWSRY